MALHVLYANKGKGPPFLIGEEGSELVRVFSGLGKSIGPPVMVGSVTAHMPQTDFEEYDGTPEEEKVILEKAQAALDAQRGADK